MFGDNRKRFHDALSADSGRNELEADLYVPTHYSSYCPSVELHLLVSHSFEVGGVIGEAMLAYNEVESWAKPKPAAFSMNFWAMKPAIRYESKGVILCIGPNNFPNWGTFVPVVSFLVQLDFVILN
jgi:hypothetical protein